MNERLDNPLANSRFYAATNLSLAKRCAINTLAPKVVIKDQCEASRPLCPAGVDPLG
jgi:hypothetical protein